MSKAIQYMRAFQGPSALDLLALFKKQYMGLVDARSIELQAIIDKSDGAYSDEAAVAHNELDRLHYAEPELHRMIQAFVAEAVKPLQDTLVEISMRTPIAPFMVQK